MDERRKLLLIVAGVFVWGSSLLVWGGWWATQTDATATVAISGGPTEAEHTQPGGSVTMPLYGEMPASVQPLTPETDATNILLNFIYEPLVQKLPDQTIVGKLANKWDVTQDGKTVTVQLREDVTWHDGHPFTADDVIDTYRRLSDPAYRGPYQETAAMIEAEGIQANEEKTVVTFYLESPVNRLADLLQVPILPQHAEGKVQDKRAVTELIGTGPYRVLDERREEKGVELIAFDHYWGEEEPSLARLSLKSLTMADAMEQFQQGKLDVLPQMDALMSEGLVTDSEATTLQKVGDVFHYIAFNSAQKLWQDASLRLAMGQALDKQQIVKEWLHGAGIQVDTPRGTQVQHPDGSTLEKVQKQLQTDTLALHFSSEWIERDVLAEILQKQWQKAGLKVELVKHKDIAALTEAIKTGQADLFLMTDWVRVQPEDLYDWWQEGSLLDWTHAYANEVQAPLQKAVDATGKEREKLIREWDERFVQEVPMLPLVRPKMLHFVSEHLYGVNVNDIRSDHIEVRGWEVKEPQQLVAKKP